MTTEPTPKISAKLAYLMARSHAATWSGLGPVDEALVEDLMTGILRAQAEQEHTAPPHRLLWCGAYSASSRGPTSTLA